MKENFIITKTLLILVFLG